MKTYKYPITSLLPNQIFVFGSNTQGRHGKGNALWARLNAGAIYGQAKGLQGQSYAIVTKDLTKKHQPSISPFDILPQIEELYKTAISTPDKEYLIPYRGGVTNLNGYTPIQMARYFSPGILLGHKFIPTNIVFEENFYQLIEEILEDSNWND